MAIAVQDDEAGKVVIHLADSVDITQAGELKAALVRALEAPGQVEIDIARITALDVTGAQLLWAAQQRALETGTALEFSGSWSDEVVASLQAAGFPAFRQADKIPSAAGGRDASAS